MANKSVDSLQIKS